ncbi:MAG: ABC transporter permease subunit [Clostridiaceae bacterium]
MNIIVQELKNNRRFMMVWTSSLAAILIVFMLIYPAMLDQASAYKEILAGVPKEVLEALSINIDLLLSYNGFYGYIYIYLMIALGVMGMILGLGMFSKEITGKTADFLLTKPLTRTTIITNKILAGMWIILMTNIILILTGIILKLILSDNGEGVKGMILISLSGFFTQMIFFSLGILIGILKKRIRFISSFAMSVVFGFFILSMVSQIMDEKALYYLTPFRYFDSNTLILKGAYESKYLALSFILILVFLGLSYVVFKKKDIHA